jgi:hypothetical protein
MRSWYEEFIEAVEVAASTLIARARFVVFGKTVYPDATFTLRLSFGKTAGYEEGTTLVPFKTTYFGLFGRNASFDNKPPFDLPQRVLEAANRINLATPLNFVTTNDTIGGNSGSPVVNEKGELVGLIFDGNRQKMGGDYAYGGDGGQARAVAVDSAGILEALNKIYGMTALIAELTGRAVAQVTGVVRD